MERRPIAETEELEPNLELDPVCGRNVDPDEAVVRYEGRPYAFCGPECRALFEHSPLRYAAAGRDLV